MNELEFKTWMKKKKIKDKVVGDIISRLKRIEREIENCDIDEQYRSDKCEALLKLFMNNGDNEEMKKYPNTTLPIGKYYMSTYRYAINQYIQFIEEISLNI